MAIDLSSIITGSTISPPRIVVYGPHGIGKTHFAAHAPSPIFLPLEDGIGTLDVQRFPLLTEWSDVMDALKAVSGSDKYATLVIDSIDWLEPIVWQETCRRHGWDAIETPNFGKGYLASMDVWREFTQAINAIRSIRSMAIILIAHADIKRFDSPITEPYDRYQIKLHKLASAHIQEWCDALLFCSLKTHVVQSDAGFSKEVTRGISTGDRMMYSEERPAHLAKNRYSMPYELPLSWSAFEAYLAPKKQKEAN